MIEIDFDPRDDASARLWSALGDLSDLLPPGWVLIGGLMVQLHAIEHGVKDVRVTTDVDVLAQARPQEPLRAIDETLRREGFEVEEPDRDGYSFRYAREGFVVDLLSAILIKARSLLVHEDPASQREDLLLLLSLVDDPRAMARDLRGSERTWLARAAEPLAFDRPANVGADRQRRARLSLRLLVGP